MILGNSKVTQLRSVSCGSLSTPFSCGSEFRAQTCPNFGPQLCWQAVVTERDVVKPQCLFNIAMTTWTWAPCLSARSQKCCVCSLLNSCGFGRNVAGWGDAHGVHWGSLRGTAEARRQAALVMNTALLPSTAALPLASVEGQVYSQTLSPDNYKPKPRRDLLETCDGAVLVEKTSFPALPSTTASSAQAFSALLLSCLWKDLSQSPLTSCCFSSLCKGWACTEAQGLLLVSHLGHWWSWHGWLSRGQGASAATCQQRYLGSIGESCLVMYCITSGAIRHQGVRTTLHGHDHFSGSQLQFCNRGVGTREKTKAKPN